MRLHIERNQEPKNECPRYFEATFRLELDETEEALAAHYWSDKKVVCGLTQVMLAGPDMEEILEAKGVTLGRLCKGVTMRSGIDKLLVEEETMAAACRNLLVFMKAASSYQGAIVIEI